MSRNKRRLQETEEEGALSGSAVCKSQKELSPKQRYVFAGHRELGEGNAAFRHISAMIRLLQYYEENKPDYSTMSDEEVLGLLTSNSQR